MPIKCPSILPTAIISDDPQLAGALACALAQRDRYLPVLDGPRLTRPDGDAEIIRRINVLARANTKNTLLAGLSPEGEAAMLAKLIKPNSRVVGFDDIENLAVDPERIARPRLVWGQDRLGLGVLTAMYSGRLIEFTDEASPTHAVPTKSGHLVVCEAHEPLSEVIAANYAYSLNAGLHIFDEVDDIEQQQLLEAFYNIDSPGVAPADERKRLASRLRQLIGPVVLPAGGSITFISKGLPFGVSLPELPTTHLFTYPDIGRTIVNGFAAEQQGTRGTNVAALVDPQKVRAPEIEMARKLLPKRGIFVRGYNGHGATVRAVTEMVDLFPYDLLLFATHCGDSSGYRWTYEYMDSEGIDRRLVVDIALGIGRTDDADKLQVLQFTRFHELDGVDWNDPIGKKGMYVGSAIRDYTEQTRDNKLEPIHKETIERVKGSAAMAMADHNYLPMPRALAAEGTPIIINNACVSWHELAGRFMFSDARAYIGTLYSVSDLEAEAIVVALLEKHFGKMLPHALWAAQNAVYGIGSDRRPYIVTGVYPQRLRTTQEDVPTHILSKLSNSLQYWKRIAAKSSDGDPMRAKANADIATYYDSEYTAFFKKWFSST